MDKLGFPVSTMTMTGKMMEAFHTAAAAAATARLRGVVKWLLNHVCERRREKKKKNPKKNADDHSGGFY